MAPLPQDYAERVYAGVLGKTIGVYLGRPFEGWTYEQIQARLGDIENYVHEELGHPLIVTDDDISGTFTFVRALADNHYNPDIKSRTIGDTWLNYLIEERTILWWGGLGNSTEHTAYLRLKQGINAPASGSARLNGRVVAEQIGAQIFIDGWAMVSPGDADRAAHFAEQAARVSHDGEAVRGAVVLAVMEAMAFVESDMNRLLDIACSYIPANSVIRRLIDDVRHWHAGEPNWRNTRVQLANRYGYDKYGGNCHMVPNHGLIIHALLHGENNFSETMKIINTCGWDTDCNSGNVGCLMGIKNGLAGIDASERTGTDWRGPVADRIYIPTADPTWGISDCANEAVSIVNAGRSLQGQAPWHPKQGAQFHFSFPGSVQGFMPTQGAGTVKNVPATDLGGDLALQLSGAESVHFGTPVFAPSKDIAKRFEKAGYALLASPRIYPGQTLAACLSATAGPANARVYASYYGENDQVKTIYSDIETVAGESVHYITLTIPAHAHPVFEVGVALDSGGTLQLHKLGWIGTPEFKATQPSHKGTMWRRAWVNGVDQFTSFVEPYRLVQNTGRGLLIQGTREWYNYCVEADVTPHLARSAGIAARVQGMRRYYALLLHHQPDQGPELRLVKMLNRETVLARCPFEWSLGEGYQLCLSVQGDQITASARDQRGTVRELTAGDTTLPCGGIALVIEEGRTATSTVSVMPPD